MLPTLVFAVGSPGWLLAGALAYLHRRRLSATAVVVTARRGPAIELVLTWIGVLWAALALY